MAAPKMTVEESYSRTISMKELLDECDKVMGKCVRERVRMAGKVPSLDEHMVLTFTDTCIKKEHADLHAAYPMQMYYMCLGAYKRNVMKDFVLHMMEQSGSINSSNTSLVDNTVYYADKLKRAYEPGLSEEVYQKHRETVRTQLYKAHNGINDVLARKQKDFETKRAEVIAWLKEQMNDPEKLKKIAEFKPSIE